MLKAQKTTHIYILSSKIFRSILILCALTTTLNLRAQESTKIKPQTLDFPLERTHLGIPLSNGKLGWLVWGSDRQLNISFSRAGFWDHRGGRDFPAEATYSKLKTALKKGDNNALLRLFEVNSIAQNTNLPSKFTQIPGGRIEILLPDDWALYKGELSLQTGELKIICKSNKGQEVAIKANIAASNELGWLQLPPVLEGQVKSRLLPAFDFLKQSLSERGIQAPQLLQNKNPENGIKGFEQKLPDDPGLGACLLQEDKRIVFSTALGMSPLNDAKRLVENFNIESETSAKDRYWDEFWQNAPRLKVPDQELQQLWDLSVYKMGCLMRPGAPVCALQGAWMEEYQLPPWANDYHFNINVQMIYLPLLMAGKFEEFEALFSMLMDKLPTFQENGKRFFEKENALLLPHATDDKGKISGSFWAGSMDHGATAWIAQMAWQYYKFTGKNEFLSKTAYPLLIGAFEGYWAMIEPAKDSSGKPVLRLPLGVSPEWGGTQISAVGPNPSFQLAACHAITQILIQASAILKKPEDERFKQVLNQLPKYALVYDSKTKEYPQHKATRIGLWEGLDLVESHRHHSHLAGIYPFNLVSISDTDKAQNALVERSIKHWSLQGQGAWAGWSYPWAASILARRNKPDAALTLLDTWQNTFVNESKATLHDAVFSGLALNERDQALIEQGKPSSERMQLDAAFGLLSAIQEICLQQRSDGLYVMPLVPRRWKNFSFDKIRTEGGFIVGGKVENGKLVRIKFTATRKEKLRVFHNLGPLYLASYQFTEDRPLRGPVFERMLAAGDEVVLKAPNVEPSRPKLIDWNPKRGK